MPLEVRCPGCGRTLRVSDEHAGRQLRCPACQHVSVAPANSSLSKSIAPPASPAARSETWHLRTPEGSLYGPATSEQLDAWVAEGRVAADCELAESANGPWRSAAELFPRLKPTAVALVEPPAVHPWTPRDVANPERAASSSGGYYVPHRGGLIFVLGLLGIVMSCPVLSLMAWVMGGHDLAEIRAGRMDKSGEGLTQAGYILGMIVSLLTIFGCVAILFLILIAAVAGS